MKWIASFMSANIVFTCVEAQSSWNQMLDTQTGMIIKKVISDHAVTSNIECVFNN